MSYSLIIADESLAIQKSVEHILSERDFNIQNVRKGEEALRIIKSELPDIALVDVDLPEINGYDLCSAIKKDSALENVQVILLAAATKGIDKKRAKQAKVDGYIIKPFEPEELLGKIDNAISAKNVIAHLKNEVQRLENRLQQAEEKAEEIGKEILEKTRAIESSEEVIAQLTSKLHQAEEANKISKDLIEMVRRQSIPEITDNIIAELKNTIEKTVEEKTPYIVERVINQMIEKIKAEKEEK